MTSPQVPFAVRLKGRVMAGPPAVRTPYVCAALGETMPPLVSSVATRFAVFADPVLMRPKFIVTTSPGSTALLVQVSTIRTRLFETICGAAEPARALIRPLPAGVPQPVHRSRPVTAKNLFGLLLLVLLPVVRSWNALVYPEPLPMA